MSPEREPNPQPVSNDMLYITEPEIFIVGSAISGYLAKHPREVDEFDNFTRGLAERFVVEAYEREFEPSIRGLSIRYTPNHGSPSPTIRLVFAALTEHSTAHDVQQDKDKQRQVFKLMMQFADALKPIDTESDGS